MPNSARQETSDDRREVGRTSAPLPAGESFGEDYFNQVYTREGVQRFMRWWSVRLHASITHRCLKRIGGRRLLEIGCGDGFTLARLENRYETFGLDISEYALKQAARFAPRSTCYRADVEVGLPTQLEPGTFDLVLAKYVFEHLKDPGAVMCRVVTMLRPGGLLFFTVPNTESIGARWKGDAWYARLDPTHCSLLPPEQWLRLVDEAGLECQRESSDGYWDLPYIRWLPKWVQFPLFIGPSALACLTGRAILPARFGENLLIVARKPPRKETGP